MSEPKPSEHNTSPRATRPMNIALSGERARRKRIEGIVTHLGELEPLRHQTEGLYTWQQLLSGEIPAVSWGGVRARSQRSIVEAGARQAKGVLSFGGSVESGADYKALAEAGPTERYKFYHSFGNQAASGRYLTGVIKQANAQGLSMTMKSFDHAYDGINIYTWHFQEMRDIIAENYEQNPEAFMDTEHFLQGEIGNVDPNHIGWVQEPISQCGQSSHSGRMGRVGSALDAEGLTIPAYMAGCEIAGVRPDMPWLLTPEYDQQLQVVAATKLHT